MKSLPAGLIFGMLLFTQASAEEAIRFKLTINEYGDCTANVEKTAEPIEKATEFVGKELKSNRTPKARILVNDEGLAKIVHNFTDPDKFEAVFPNGSGGPIARFDDRFKALVLTSNEGKPVTVTLGQTAKLPLTIVYDRPHFARDAHLRLHVASQELGMLGINIFTTGLSTGDAKFYAYWDASKDGKQQPRKPIVTDKEFSLKSGTTQTFRLPVPSAKITSPFQISLVAGGHAIQEISSLLIEGKLSPSLGIIVGGQNSTLFVEEIAEGSIAQGAGIKQGDVIVSINGTKPKSLQDANGLLNSVPLGTVVEVVTSRVGRESVVRMLAE